MDVTETNEIVLRVLENIPLPRDHCKSIEDIARSAAESLDMSYESVLGATRATLAFVNLFELLTWQNGQCRLAEQNQEYFNESLKWYITNRQPILTNWGRPGAAANIHSSNILEAAPHFLRILEERRLRIASAKKIDVGFSRLQKVAIVFIKGVASNTSYLLHQWDSKAEQYQLIGGRQRPDESILDTAKRELLEEIGSLTLLDHVDYEVRELNTEPVEALRISRTYGALTKYQFWLFHAKFKIGSLKLTDLNKWIELKDVRKGKIIEKTKEGKKVKRRVDYPDQVRAFDAVIQGGLEGLEKSISIQHTLNWWDWVEIKLPLFGVLSFDIKALINRLLKGGDD